jgi:hypothetical protein
VADALVREIDTDGDAVLSQAERRAYSQHVLSGLSLRIDDGAVPLQLAVADFPAVATLRGGDAAIVLRIDARPPHLTAGAHRVSFRNGNATHGAVYLANALLPEIADRDHRHAARDGPERPDRSRSPCARSALSPETGSTETRTHDQADGSRR